jgi:hypothetical protein
MNLRRVRIVGALLALLLTLFAVPTGTASAAPALPLPCHAWMTNPHPFVFSYVGVHVQTTPFAQVTGVEHDIVLRKHIGQAGPLGGVTLWFSTGATPGFRVFVTIATHRGGRWGFCLTSFVAHR